MLKRLSTAVLVALFLVSPAQPALADDSSDLNKPVRDKWALIVGVSRFQSKAVPPLKYAAKDAKDFRDFLVKEANFAPDHVRLLLDEKATQRRVLSELGNKFLARVAKPDDLVVLFFSSHGSPSQADVRGKNFVVAHDSDPEDLFTTGIEMDKIIESIQARILSERVVLVLDACHSGAVEGSAKGIGRSANFDAEALAQGSGQMVICSSLPDQQSWESKRYQNGIFTKQLLEGLRKNGNRTTLQEAFKHVRNSVPSEVKEDYGKPQEPVLKSKWSGNELILASPAAAPQAVPAAVQEILEADSSVPGQSITVSAMVPGVAPPPTVQPVQSAPPAVQHSTPTSTLPNASPVSSSWKKGIDLYNRGDFASAADLLAQATKTPPGKTQGEAFYYLANAYMKLNKTDRALAAYREAFKFLPPGKKADYCLQVINYYSSRPTAKRIEAAPLSQPAVTTGNVLTSSTQLPGSATSSIPPEVLNKVRSTLPRRTTFRALTPALTQVISWTAQDKAAYVSEACDRVARVRESVREAQEQYNKAKSAVASLVPNSRAYGESEDNFRVRVNAGQIAVSEFLVPYSTEVELRSRFLADEESILQTCQSSYNQLYGGVYGVGVGVGTSTVTTPAQCK